MPPQWRSLAFGAGTAAGSFGQFLFSPLAVALIDGYGWRHTLVIFAAIVLLIIPLSLAFAAPRTNGAAAAATAPQQSLAQALTEALGHRSYWLLVLGFFTCGFQIFFIAVHLPAYLVDRGLAAEIGGWTLGVIGLVQHGGRDHGRLALGFDAQALSPVDHLFCTRGGDPRLHHAATERGRDPDLRGSAGPALALDRAAHLGPRHRHVRHSLARHAVRLLLSSATRSAVSSACGLAACCSSAPDLTTWSGGSRSLLLASCQRRSICRLWRSRRAAPRCRSRLNPLIATPCASFAAVQESVHPSGINY